MSALTNYRYPPRLIFAPNHVPVAADSAAGRKGVHSTTKGESRKRTEESLLSSGRFRLSPATGTYLQAPPSSFINLTFTSQRSLLWYFLGLQESTVLPVSSPSPPAPSSHQKSQPAVERAGQLTV